ncbi:two-component sensor histidine kinase [Geomonas sp. Red276]
MKMRIKYRLFFAMLAATGAVVIGMFLIVQWSIGRGFLTYVNTVERDRLERLSEVLEQTYTAEGGWDFLQEDRDAWPRLLAYTMPREGSELERFERRQGLRAGHPGQPGNPGYSGQASRPGHPAQFSNMSAGKIPPWFAHRFETRVFLLDASRRQIAGPPGLLQSQVDFKKILSGHRTVGYLGIRPRQRLTDTHQLLFVKQQKVALVMIAAVMFLVSAVISLPLSNRLVSPIRRLAASMHRLACGEYGTRVQVGTEDELGQLARDFNTLALALENNEQARRRWVADISHELRTPLSILRGEIEAIQDGVRPGGPDSMRSLHAEVMHLSRLVEDLYQISLYDIGALSYRKELIDLREMLEQAVEAFESEFDQKNIELTADFGGTGELPLFADAGRLQQLFDNLLENTLKYTDAGGKLSVRLEDDGDRVALSFEDSAPGVPPEDLERLFDRLYRVESSRNRSLGGAGLGLAICKNIVEAHEGSITAHPSSMGGILIRIELPLAGSRG